MEIFQSANWITCALANEGSAIAFYRNLSFSGKVKRADLYVSAVGVYDLFINGKKIDENYMKTPAKYKRLAAALAEITEFFYKNESVAYYASLSDMSEVNLPP